jgi:hypothetical protein
MIADMKVLGHADGRLNSAEPSKKKEKYMFRFPAFILTALCIIAGSSAAPAQTSTLVAQAVVSGTPWPSSGTVPVSYTIVGPSGRLRGTGNVPSTFTGLTAGTYKITYDGGGPANTTLVGMGPCSLTASFSTSCSVSLSAGQTLSLTFQFVETPQPIAFAESFNNAPDDTNNWYVSLNNGTNSMTYTSGSLLMYADYSDPYPPGSSIGLASNVAFSGDVDVTFQFDHEGYGRTSVGIWEPNSGGYLAEADLDTDDTCYLNFGTGAYSTQYEYSCAPYMDLLVPIRLQVQGNQITFYADGNPMVTFPYSPPPTGPVQLGFNSSSVPWKSGSNYTTFTSVTATGTVPVPCASNNNYVCGCLQDTYKDVPAFYNGTVISAACAGRGTYGLQYECPEYVNRFYAEAKDVVMTSAWLHTNGGQYYSRAAQLGLVAYPNCTTYPQTPCASNALPQPDDMVSFCNFDKTTGSCTAGPGHVSIIRGVTTNGTTSTVTFIEQNYSKQIDSTSIVTQNPDGTYTMADRENGKLRAWGWLRLPAKDRDTN